MVVVAVVAVIVVVVAVCGAFIVVGALGVDSAGRLASAARFVALFAAAVTVSTVAIADVVALRSLLVLVLCWCVWIWCRAIGCFMIAARASL